MSEEKVGEGHHRRRQLIVNDLVEDSTGGLEIAAFGMEVQEGIVAGDIDLELVRMIADEGDRRRQKAGVEQASDRASDHGWVWAGRRIGGTEKAVPGPEELQGFIGALVKEMGADVGEVAGRVGRETTGLHLGPDLMRLLQPIWADAREGLYASGPERGRDGGRPAWEDLCRKGMPDLPDKVGRMDFMGGREEAMGDVCIWWLLLLVVEGRREVIGPEGGQRGAVVVGDGGFEGDDGG